MTSTNLILCLLLILTTIFSSCKKETNQTVTVIRDCTGTYLRLNGKDYHVCNLGKVTSFPTGTTVTATFKKLTECNDSDNTAAVCYMLHENEGWIEVTKIK